MMRTLFQSGLCGTTRLTVEGLGLLEEGRLVFPDEIDLKQLEAQITPVGIVTQCPHQQFGRLVIKTIGHVELGFGNDISLVDLDGTISADRALKRCFRITAASLRPPRPGAGATAVCCALISPVRCASLSSTMKPSRSVGSPSAAPPTELPLGSVVGNLPVLSSSALAMRRRPKTTNRPASTTAAAAIRK